MKNIALIQKTSFWLLEDVLRYNLNWGFTYAEETTAFIPAISGALKCIPEVFTSYQDYDMNNLPEKAL